MKRKFTVLIASLLLAVGWTNVASAQLLTKQAAPNAFNPHSKALKAVLPSKVPYRNNAIKDLVEAPTKPVKSNNSAKVEYLEDTYTSAPMMRAPRRATYTEKADVVKDFAYYEGITYNWVDGDGAMHTSKLTDPATDPNQMAYLVGSAYINPEVPGIKYTEGKRLDHPYSNIAYAYDIPANARWYIGSGNSNPVGNITIAMDNGNLSFQTIKVKSGNTVLTEWSYASNGTSLPASWSTTKAFTAESTSSCYMSGGGTITINASLLQGATDVTVEIYGRHDPDYSQDVVITVAGSTGTSSSQTLTQSNNSEWATFTWNVLGTSSSATSVTPPYDNGYTVFITKLKDGVHDNNEPEHTNTWAELISYFNTYFESIELLTDGVRVGASTATSDAGTVFTYTGNLNKFFFISKGKMYYLSSDRAPFYSMYEEFSPTTTESGDEITDFFERMDQGEAYGVIHDCQSVNYMEHFFSMTGKDGTTHNTLSNLIFYIPDDRGVYGSRNYDHQPRVGLYTADIEATATPNKTQEHTYDVTVNWSTSLETILGFDEPETHDLWVVVRDQQGNIVLDSLLTTTDGTTYTYQVPQYPESYTIDYIVRAWPTAADEPVDHTATSDGTFYADTDVAEVTIPGYKDFISLRGDRHECDFDIDNEYNYYRNFFSLLNQNGVAGLTTAQIDAGMNTFHLYRYDHNKPEPRTEAATLNFTHEGNQVNWEVTYPTQYYYPNHTPGESKYYLTTMKIPTSGSFTVGTSGGGVTYDTTFTHNSAESIDFSQLYTYSGYFTVNSGNWSSSSNAMYGYSDGYAYIRSGSSYYLQYTVPQGYSNQDILFAAYVGSTGSGYLGYILNDDGTVYYNQATTSSNWVYLYVGGVSAGDVIKFIGLTPGTSGASYAVSPEMSDIYVYDVVVTETEAENALIDVSGIQIVDQFRDNTANDSHPYLYDYVLEYTGRNTADWDTTRVSNVMIVPVQHSSSVLNGFYTFEEMIHDSIPTLLQEDVKNAEINMSLTADAEVFYYTLMRNPANAWSRITYTQKDNNNTFYTEGMNYLPQYAGAVNYPGDEIERLDNAEVLTGSYNDYMRYTPITWTYGYDRFYYDAEGLPSGLTPDGYHNSYGSPIWKTGVGKVTVNSVEVQRQVKNDQTNEDNPATSWKDETGADCNVYFLGVDATGMLPTTNMKGEGGSNYYEPYMFRVWVKSNSGSLRGYTPMSSNNGDYVVNDPTLDRNMQVVYEEYTNSTVLDKSLPENYTNARNIIKFGALKGIQPTDLQVIVRFYYKVKHIDPVDNSMDNMVTIDFTDNPWQIPAGNIASWQTNNTDYTDGNLTIGLANKYFYNENIGFLMLGENGQLTLPTFDRKVKQIQVVGRPGASNSVKMNVFVGNDAVSTEATGSLGTNTFNINEQYQQIGTQYILKVTNAYNAQISKVIVIFEEEETNGFMMRAPKREGAGTVYEKVTSADQIVAGKNYILVSEDNNLALTSTATGNFLAGEAVTITNNTVTIGAGSSIAEFTLGGSVGSWTLANGSNYLNAASSSGNLKLNSTATTWTITNDNGSLNGFRVKHSDASRAVIYFDTYSRFGNYAFSNIGTNYHYAWLYVEKEGTTPTPTPELTAPTDGATVNVGTNTGNGVSVPVTISGSDLTENLTVAVSGEGFSVSTNSVDYAAANAGTSVTVTYNGTTANATGTLTISSSEVGTITVNLTATYDGGTTPPEDEPMLIAPVNGSTVFVGTTSAETPSVSQVITVIGDLLTKDLTATITGEGFAFQTRDITIPYADVNNGTSVTVVYNGTDENARGTLTLASDEVSAVVNLTASYRKPVVLSIEPAGYVTQDEATVDEITTGIIETLFEQMRGEVVGVTYVNALGMQSDKPFEGINIVVTRYSDGTTSTNKVRY